MPEEVTFVGLSEFTGAILGFEARIALATMTGLREAGSALERAAKRNSTGRPGPMVRTGAHRRGIIAEGVRSIAPGTWQVRVGPTMVYSRRLELGFHGLDRRGRRYDQPAYPYMRPAMEDTPVDRYLTRRWQEVIE